MSQPHPLDPATVAILRPAIIQILNNADLSSISAKKVRAQLAPPTIRSAPGLDLSASKKAVDEVIRDCFDHISKACPLHHNPHQLVQTAPPPHPHPGGLALQVSAAFVADTLPPALRSRRQPAPAKSTPSNPKRRRLQRFKVKAEPKPKKKATKKRAAADDDDDETKSRAKKGCQPQQPFNRRSSSLQSSQTSAVETK